MSLETPVLGKLVIKADRRLAGVLSLGTRELERQERRVDWVVSLRSNCYFLTLFPCTNV